MHAVPNLGRKDQGAGTPLCELMVDGLGMDPGLNSIGPAGKGAGKGAGKDADMEVMEASEAAAGGVIGMRQSERQGEKKIER